MGNSLFSYELHYLGVPVAAATSETFASCWNAECTYNRGGTVRPAVVWSLFGVWDGGG